MNEKKNFDLAIIGAGPGGYVAAIQAAQLGQHVALIEKNFIGGTCLNIGCIPTKTLLSSAQRLEEIKTADHFGIEAKDVSFNYEKMVSRKDNVVTQLRQSLIGLIQANKIEIIRGEAKFISQKELKILGENNCILAANNIIIAVGSIPRKADAFVVDGITIHDSTSILDIKKIPKSLAIIGGGYIGCEFASLFQSFGTHISIIEALDSIIFYQEPSIAAELTRIFKEKGADIFIGKKVLSLTKTDKSVKIVLDTKETIDSEMVLVSIGRQYITDSLDLQKAGVKTNDYGVISVNSQMQTNIPGIYAIGDVTGKWLLAHYASHSGIVAAYNCTGQIKHLHDHGVPSVIFTHPEIASVGMKEKFAKEKGYDVLVGKYPYKALGKALASDQIEGFAIIIADKKNHHILGAHIIGANADILIAEMTLAIENELSLECILETIHTHPTFSEIWMETAALTKGTPLHFPPRKG